MTQQQIGTAQILARHTSLNAEEIIVLSRSGHGVAIDIGTEDPTRCFYYLKLIEVRLFELVEKMSTARIAATADTSIAN